MFENAGVKHILSCTCTDFFYISKYVYCGQRADIMISPHVVCLLPTCTTKNCTRSGRMVCCFLHVGSKHGTCAHLCYLSNIDIFQYMFIKQNSTCARQNTLNFIILEFIPVYTLVSEEHVC